MRNLQVCVTDALTFKGRRSPESVAESKPLGRLHPVPEDSARNTVLSEQSTTSTFNGHTASDGAQSVRFTSDEGSNDSFKAPTLEIPAAVLSVLKKLPKQLPNNIPSQGCPVSVFADYQNLFEIGSGTYAKVYKLKRKSNGSITAGKFLQPQSFPANTAKRVIQMFANEILLLARTQCEGVVGFYRHLWGPDGILLELEFVDDGTIWRDSICPDPISRLNYFLQLLQTVLYFQKTYVVHRDLKPTNILKNVEGKLKIADFGWADDTVNLTPNRSEWPGTLEINPPEVLKFKGPLTERIDNYAVGMNFLLITSNRFVCRQKGLSVNVAVPVILRMVESLRKSTTLPCNFTEESWAVFLGLTHPDPLERWSLIQVLQHPHIVNSFKLMLLSSLDRNEGPVTMAVLDRCLSKHNISMWEPTARQVLLSHVFPADIPRSISPILGPADYLNSRGKSRGSEQSTVELCAEWLQSLKNSERHAQISNGINSSCWQRPSGEFMDFAAARQRESSPASPATAPSRNSRSSGFLFQLVSQHSEKSERVANHFRIHRTNPQVAPPLPVEKLDRLENSDRTGLFQKVLNVNKLFEWSSERSHIDTVPNMAVTSDARAED